MIRRTDFAAPVDVPAKILKATKQIRDRIIDKVLAFTINTGPVSADTITCIRKKVSDIYKQILLSAAGYKEQHHIEECATRKLEIELAYLDALGRVSKMHPELTRLGHKLSALLEKGADKAGFYWMSTPSCISAYVLPGLDSEVSFPVAESSTYLIGSLPAEYKRNFMRVMDEFAIRCTAEARRNPSIKPKGELVNALLGAQRDWQIRAERIGIYFGLNPTALSVSA